MIAGYRQFVFHWRHSVWVVCLTVLLLNATLITSTGLLQADAVALGFSSREHLLGMLLLVTLMPTWLLGCFIATQRHSLAMARRVDPKLAAVVTSLPTRQVLLGMGLGLFYALAFNVPYSQFDLVLQGNGPMIAIFVGQLLVWVCVGLLIAVRLHVVNGFFHLGKKIEISIFEQSRLEPFARVGMLDVLIVVGGLAIATVQSIDAQFRLGNYLTAFIVAIPAGTALLVRPMWSLHQRLSMRKAQLLEDVCQQLRNAPEQSSSTDITALEVLLKRRDRIKALHTWPLDLAIWSRLMFYVLIPPIAWSGAALVEVVIDKMLGI